MACRSSSKIALLTTLFFSLASTLQVTPNSPCASFCIDSLDLDKSDPNSSNTNGTDITCSDDDFTDKPEGQKFQRCLSCLQDSAFEQGSENDQNWFLYNLRYSFDYCIFGYPNAVDVGSNPCMTSEACGPLDEALKAGIKDPAHREQYDYCNTEGKPMLSDAVERCRSCVKADSSHSFMSNFLIALEAGCQQQPAPGITVGLNDTVFVKTTIEIIDPSANSTSTDSGIHLPTTAIAGISIGAVGFLILVAGCIFMQCRKRKNRTLRSRTRHVRASSLSFRCQTHLTPREPGFRQVDEESLEEVEKPYMDPALALSSNPPPRESSLWNSKSSMTGLKTSPKLASLTTTLPCPPPAHTSPKVASPDDYTTPTSTTSVRSNAPLLSHKPYIPSEHTISPQAAFQPQVITYSPQISSPLASPGFGIASPRMTDTFMTLPKREGEMQWEEQRVRGPTRDLMRKKGSWGAVAPVEVRNIQTTFAPPPKSPKKY
ncbi:Fc.00g051890.m01.CDS01 [Cosmosporella sp. VM-42]